MLLDEWLGTDDAQFVRRARMRMMGQGRIVFDGDISDALAEYARLYPVSERTARAAKVKRRRIVKAAEAKMKKKLAAKIRSQVEAELKGQLPSRSGKHGAATKVEPAPAKESGKGASQ